MMTKNNSGADSSDRLTVSLGPGQRKALEDIAALNGTTLAFVVRYGISQFIESHSDKQIPLRFPVGLGKTKQ